MSLLLFPDEILLYIIYFLESDDFYRFIKSNKMLNNNFKCVKLGMKNKWIHIFLQVKMNNLFYKEHKLIISRSGNEMINNLNNFIENYDERGKKYCYSHINYNTQIRNIRMYKSSIYYTKFIKNRYVKIANVPYTCEKIHNIYKNIITTDETLFEKRKNKYYIMYNSCRKKDGKLNILSKINYTYNEWDFDGIYVCNSIDDILESLIVLLKRGISHIYKWLEINRMDSILDYIYELLKYTNKKTINFINQLRWAPIYTDRMYKIDIINRWKRIYEYGNTHLGIDDGTREIIETMRDGSERYIVSYSLYDIDGFGEKKDKKTTSCITEYFF